MTDTRSIVGNHRREVTDGSVGGRPTKLTPELEEKFLEAIRAGNYREVVAASVGISAATMYRWLSDAREPYRSFREALLATEASVEMGAVSSIKNQVPKDPKLALEFLSRRYPQRWAPVRSVEGGRSNDTQDGRGNRPHRIDRQVQAGYQQLTVADRWARTLLAAASDNDEELRRLRETCPPDDRARVSRMQLKAEFVVARAATAWFQSVVRYAIRLGGVVGRMLGIEMYGLGLSDGRSELLPGQGYRDRFLFRVGPVGEAFAKQPHTDFPEAEKKLRSVWQGICEFSERIGMADVKVLLAVQPGLFEAIQDELALISDGELDQDVVLDTADWLWKLWEAR